MTDDERDLRAAIERDPDDDGARLIYADWLEEQGELARASWLRCEIAFRRAKAAESEPSRSLFTSVFRRRADDPVERARRALESARANVPAEWVAEFARAPIENRRCTTALVRHVYDCPNEWERLVRTDHPLVRECQTCQRRVFYCASLPIARAAVRRGQCVVVDGDQPRQPGDLDDRVEAMVSRFVAAGEEAIDCELPDRIEIRERPADPM